MVAVRVILVDRCNKLMDALFWKGKLQFLCSGADGCVVRRTRAKWSLMQVTR